MIGWYIVPYEIIREPGLTYRRVAICRYSQQIKASGGQWTETEVLGDRAIVKVRASQAVLDGLNTVFLRVPKERLDDPLADLPLAVKQKIKNEILDMGYTLQGLQERFPQDLGQYTLRDVLTFMASRRLKPRYVEAEDNIYVDGIVQACRPIESVDEEVQE